VNANSLYDLVKGLRTAGLEYDALGLAETLWLACSLPVESVASTEPAGGTRPQEPSAERSEKPIRGKDHQRRPVIPPTPRKPGRVQETETNLYPATVTTEADDTVAARAVRVAAGSALPRALEIGRALRPLIRYRESRFQGVLDEEATADCSAENEGRVMPVFRPMRERLFDLALVIDDSPTMAIWQKTADEFQRLLERHGAFRDVHRWTLKFSPQLGLYTNSGTRVSPKTLLDPTGHRLIILFTQGTHSAWTQRELTQWLWVWAANDPVVIAQVLPEPLWTYTRLGEPTASVFTYRPAAPNTRFVVERPWWYEVGGPPTLAVPVFALEPKQIMACAEMIMGVRRTFAPALLFELPGNVSLRHEDPSNDRQTPEQLLSQFRAYGSDESYELACYLSQIQFTLPVMRLVQQAMLGRRSSQSQLAEVLLSGLIERADQNQVRDCWVDPEQVVYRLRQDVRHVLRSRLSLDAAFSVARSLATHIEQRLGGPIDFTALVEDPSGTRKLPKWAQPFAIAGGELARQLGLASSAGHDRVKSESLGRVAKAKREAEVVQRPAISDFKLVRRLADGGGNLRRIAWSPDGTTLAGGGFDEVVRVWDVQSGKTIHSWRGHSGVIYAVCWSPDGKQLASGGADAIVRVWDLDVGRLVHICKTREKSVLGLAWSPDGTAIACGTDTGRILLWDAKTGEQKLRFDSHKGSVHSVAWSPDGGSIVSSSNDGSVRILSLAQMGNDNVLGRHAGQVYGIAWSPDGSLIASSGSDNEVRLWDRSGREMGILRGHTRSVTDLSFSHDGLFLASISWDDTVRIWNTKTQLQTTMLRAQSAKRFHTGISFHPRLGYSLAVVTAKSSAIEIWQPEGDHFFEGTLEIKQEVFEFAREPRLTNALVSLGIKRREAVRLLGKGPGQLCQHLLQRARNRTHAFQDCLAVIRSFAQSTLNELVIHRNGNLTVFAEEGPSEDLGYARTSISWDGLIGRAARTKSVVWAPDVSLESDYIPFLQDTAAELAVPLVSADDDSLLGVLNVELTERDSLPEVARQWLVQFSQPLATALARRLRSIFIISGPDDRGFATRLAKDLEDVQLSAHVEHEHANKAQHWSQTMMDAIASNAWIISVISQRSSQSLIHTIDSAREAGPLIQIIPVIVEKFDLPPTLASYQSVDFSKSYISGLQLLVKTLRPGESQKSPDLSWHPREDAQNRGPLSAAIFRIDSDYKKHGANRWAKWADVLVQLDNPPNDDFVYLVPSNFAPRRFWNRDDLRDTRTLQEKRRVTRAFIEERGSRDLRGFWFVKTMANGSRAVQVYCQDYDEYLSSVQSLRDLESPSPPATIDDEIALEQEKLRVAEGRFGRDHPQLIPHLDVLAKLLEKQGDLDHAEQLLRRSLRIGENGPTAKDTSARLNNLAILLGKKGDYQQANRLLERALKNSQDFLDAGHPDVIRTIRTLARFSERLGNDAEAEQWLHRTLRINEMTFGPDHVDIARDLNELARFAEKKGDQEQAAQMLRRALTISQTRLGLDHRFTRQISANLEHISARPRISEEGPAQHPGVGYPMTEVAESTNVIYKDDPREKHGLFLLSRGEHQLKVPRLFRIGVYPVTNSLFLRFVESGGYADDSLWEGVSRSVFLTRDGKTQGPSTWIAAREHPSGALNHPVTGICYLEAKAFTKWLEREHPEPNCHWCLPTEDMWELAARSLVGYHYPWGWTYTSGLCNSAEQGLNGTSEVGRFKTGNSPYGCADMAGNAWEFVESPEYASAVLKGGSFKNNQHEIKSYLRLVHVPVEHRPPDFGLRCAQIVSDAELDEPKLEPSAGRNNVAPAGEQAGTMSKHQASDQVALNDSLDRLAKIDPRQAKVVELRFFGGLTVEEAANVLGVPPEAVDREWSVAKAWLDGDLKDRYGSAVSLDLQDTYHLKGLARYSAFRGARVAALRGFIGPEMIREVANVVLPEKGGEISQSSDSFRYEGILSCKVIRSRIASGRNERTGGQTILLTVTVEDLDVMEVLLADRLVAQIAAEYSRETVPLAITFLGTRFENLRIGGASIHVALEVGHFEAESWDQFAAQVQTRTEVQAKRNAGEQRQHGSGKVSLVKEIKGAPIGTRVMGNMFEIPFFGRISLGELAVGGSGLELTMLRHEFAVSGNGEAQIEVGNCQLPRPRTGSVVASS
jgi:formylglycine-generating enzyme required for sulfatase activity